MKDLESLIRRHVPLGRPTAKGWHGVRCRSCGDYKERGAFNFGGGAVVYNCFNCGAKAVYTGGDARVSKNMRGILESFGVPGDEIDRALGAAFFEPGKELRLGSKKAENGPPTTEQSLPAMSHEVSSDGSPWCEVAREYLRSRGIDPASKKFFVSEDAAYSCRVIIPYYFRGKLVYWQGRSMDPSVEPRYKNPTAERDNIFFNMDEVYSYTDAPLYVTEGPLDALSVGDRCVATLGSTISEFKMRELTRAAEKRKVVFVIDKNDQGLKMGHRVLREGVENFYIACMPDNIEDANDALVKLGRLFLASHLASTATNGVSARVLLEVKCTKKKR